MSMWKTPGQTPLEVIQQGSDAGFRSAITIQSGQFYQVPEGKTIILPGRLTVEGRLLVKGRLEVV